jgi:hypothetical protein
MAVMKALLAVLFIALGAACSSGRYAQGGATAAGSVTELTVLGSRPSVLVLNGGPGRLDVQLSGTSERRSEAVTAGTPGAEHRIAGPVRVRLEARGPQAANWKVLVRNASGLRLESGGEPGAAPRP